LKAQQNSDTKLQTGFLYNVKKSMKSSKRFCVSQWNFFSGVLLGNTSSIKVRRLKHKTL